MKSCLTFLSLILLTASVAFGQGLSTVTATITDPDGQTWNNGAYAINLVPAPNTTQPPSWIQTPGLVGTPFAPKYVGNLTSSGVLNITLPDNDFIFPLGTQWSFTLCSNTSASCQTIVTSVTGVAPDLSTALSAPLTAPRFISGCGAGTYARVDGTGCEVPVNLAAITDVFGCTSSSPRFLESNGTSNTSVLTIGWTPLACETRAFLARLATTPTTAQTTAYNNLISGLVYSGVWAKLDGFFLFAAPNSADALTNLIQAGTATVSGSPTFAANAGYTPTTSSDYIDSGFNPTTARSPNYTQNNASLFAWRSVSPSDDGGALAALPSGNNYTYVEVPYNGLQSDRLNSTGAAQATTDVNTGLYGGSRVSSSTVMDAYQDGILLSSVSTTATSAATNADFIGLNYLTSGGTATTGQEAALGFGGGLTYVDFMNLYNYLDKYITTVAGGATLGTPTYTQQISALGNFNYGPGIARLQDGRLIATFAVGNGSFEDGVLEYALSSNNGKTWGSAVTIATPASGYNFTDTSVTVLSSGSIVVIADYDTSSPSVLPVVYIGTVSAGSINWGSQIGITSVLTSPSTTSYALPLHMGSLMLGLYSRTAKDKITVEFSSNGGSSWGTETTVVDVAVTGNSDRWGESNYQQLPNGTIVGILRNDNSVTPSRAGWWVVTSRNNGATWSSPTQIFGPSSTPLPMSANDQSRPAMAVDPLGNLFVIGRFDNRPNGGADDVTAWTYSTNGGVTWSNPVPYFNVKTFQYGPHLYAQGFWDAVTSTFMYAIGQNSARSLGNCRAASRWRDFVGCKATSIETFQQFSPLTATGLAQIVPVNQGGHDTHNHDIPTRSNLFCNSPVLQS
jgi:hypothetical protein